jgi:electron transport complex protein RnfG
MAKKESTFTNMVLTLFLVTLGASAALGYVYELTKDDIKDAEEAKKTLAIKRVVPAFDNVPGNDFFKYPTESSDTLIFYVAKNGDDTVGYAVETFSKNAFSGLLKLLVGLKPDGTINNIAVLEHKETPGLGSKMLKSQTEWSYQFNNKNPENFNLKVVKDGGEVDAITASTITSRAYSEAVQRAYDALKKTQAKEGGQP